MSATYNWAYKPGVTNKYGLTVPAGADNVRPFGWCYVGLFGNDTNGNGSRQYPYRSIAHARLSAGQNTILVLSSGVYREADVGIINTTIGDGDVIIDISFFTGLSFFGNFYTNAINVFNIKFIGDSTQRLGIDANSSTYTIRDCDFDGIQPYSGGYAACMFTNVVVSNLNSLILSDGNMGKITNCTFINIRCLSWSASSTLMTNCIYMNCNINISSALTSFVRYSIFFNCNFRFGSNNGNGNLYPSVPSGYVHLNTIADINDELLATFPTSLTVINSIYADPKFNNLAIQDFTLSFDSPAKNLSYFGTYVGARSIAYPLRISTIEESGVFDLSSAINLTIANDSITLTDPSTDGMIETIVITNDLGRQIKSLSIYGFNADRNGEYIDSIADLDNVTKSVADILNIPASYIVEDGTISYNSTVLTAGQRFTTVSGQTSFISSTGGIVREILEAPQRHTIEMKVSDIQPFTTEQYNHYESGITPTTNNIDDSRTGVILRGNGDPLYIRGDAVEFPINSKYIKIRLTIRANNLKP
jgi:hypothetical protein